jgi:hypothetical protein
MPVGVPPSAEAEVTTRRTFLGEDMLAGEKKRAVVIKVQYYSKWKLKQYSSMIW